MERLHRRRLWLAVLLAWCLGYSKAAPAAIAGRRLAIDDDFPARGPNAFYGDTHQPTAWLPTGSFTYNGVTMPGSVIATMNDGGRDWLPTSPELAGSVFLTRISSMDWSNPSNTVEDEFASLAHFNVGYTWTPAAGGACTAGFVNQCDWKSRDPFSIDGNLYLFVYRQEGPGSYRANDATLIKSADGGMSWTNPAHIGASTDASGDPPMGPGDPSSLASLLWPESYPNRDSALGHLMIVQMCQDGSINCPSGPGVAGCDPASYVCFFIESYDFSTEHLARVRRTDLPNLSARDWQYFQGGDGTQDSAWTSSFSTMAALPWPCALSGMTYLKDLGIYYLTGKGAHSIDHYWGPHPWGPWTEFFYEDFPWATAGAFPTPILATARRVSSNPTHVQIAVAATRYDHDGEDNHFDGKNTYLLMDLTDDPAVTSSVQTPIISPSGSRFTRSISVTLTCPTPNAQIRYTTDGSEPGAASVLYGGPFTLTDDATVRAKAFLVGLLPSSEPSPATFTVQAAPAPISLAGVAAPAVRVYPNPWRQDRHAARSVIFAGLEPSTSIKIFTASGRVVREIRADTTTIDWDLTNASGEKVGSGLYVYVAAFNGGEKARGKLAILR